MIKHGKLIWWTTWQKQDIIRSGSNGRLFRPDDPEDLARQIAGVLSGDGVSATPEQIRDSARHHAASVAWGRYHALYRRLLADWRVGSPRGPQ